MSAYGDKLGGGYIYIYIESTKMKCTIFIVKLVFRVCLKRYYISFSSDKYILFYLKNYEWMEKHEELGVSWIFVKFSNMAFGLNGFIALITRAGDSDYLS